MSKFYTVYKVLFDSCYSDKRGARDNFVMFGILNGDGESFRSIQNYFDEERNGDKEEIKRDAIEARIYAREQKRKERYGYASYHHNIFIGRCDRELRYIPSLAEVKTFKERMDIESQRNPDFKLSKVYLEKYAGLSPKEILKKYMDTLSL
jgi:hypothetical protein